MSRPTLTLIDGSGYLYRAFHALPPLTNRTGEPTGALFGVFNMVRLALKSKPDYVAFVSDAAGPTFRDELFAEYKAHRPAMPDDLRVQIEPMLALVGALGFPILRVDGVEADDVIGTLALQAAASGIDVVVSTGDKDLAQLVGPHITLVNTMTNSTLDVAGVKAKFGVAPEQIIDYLALVGDSSDNIPGVEKCGPKTAAKWLAEYGTLDGVIANADKIGGKIGENLRAALPQLPLSRQLATVKTDVALDVVPAGLTLRAPDTEKLREFYRRYEFNAALKELEASIATSSGASPEFALSSPAPEVRDGEAAQPSALSPQPSPQSTSSPANAALAPEGLNAKGEYELVLTLAQLDDWLAKLR
ncbi:MAG TPA: 5'-3' exonuclease H3TH domain-containing protein, partial [Rudaea sp.]|nr:5'-3' exonuclease H3TH domain-containing protein [Rudaea sp.]